MLSSRSLECFQQSVSIALMFTITITTMLACRDNPKLAPGVFKTIIWATFLQGLAVIVTALGVSLPSWVGIEPRTHSIAALIGVACATALGRCYRRRYYAVAGVLTVIIGAGLSRTSTAAALVVMYLGLAAGASWKRLLAGILFVAALYVLWIQFIFPLAVVRARLSYGDQALTVGDVTISSMGRRVLWAHLLEGAMDSPLWGHGIATSRAIGLQFSGGLGHPHNDYLRVFYEYGLFGLSIWLLSYLTILRRLIANWTKLERRGSPSAMFASGAALSVLGFMMVMITDNAMVYYFALAPLACVVGTGLAASSRRWNVAFLRSQPARGVQRMLRRTALVKRGVLSAGATPVTR